jgi:putative addiction module component (TIGR02574 family)
MTQSAESLLATALLLPAADRAELAARLLDSLDPADDADREDAWSDEIKRRLDDVESGRVPLIPWAEVRQGMRDDRNAER